jgi:hypothetical protein
MLGGVRFLWVQWPARGHHVVRPSMMSGLARHGGRMPRHKKATLRRFSVQEQSELTQICRSRVTPAAARGDDDQTDVHSVGRRSGDAASHLAARSNAKGTAIQTRRGRHGSS